MRVERAKEALRHAILRWYICVEEVASGIDIISGLSIVGGCRRLAGHGALCNVKGVLKELIAYPGIGQT